MLRAGHRRTTAGRAIAPGRPGIILAIATAVAVLIGLPDAVGGTLAILAGLAAAARLSGGGALPGQPIVWVLHLPMACWRLGFGLWGLAQLGLGDEWLRCMSLASRRRGRHDAGSEPRLAGPQRPGAGRPGPVALAYALIPVAVVLRWAGSTFPASFTCRGDCWGWHGARPLRFIWGGGWPLWVAPSPDRRPHDETPPLSDAVGLRHVAWLAGLRAWAAPQEWRRQAMGADDPAPEGAGPPRPAPFRRGCGLLAHVEGQFRCIKRSLIFARLNRLGGCAIPGDMLSWR